MATPSTNATQNSLGTLSQWSDLYKLFSGSSGATTTRTQQTGLSAEATQAMVQSILESSQGLANVSAGQKKSGLYSSSTNQMLTNKLVSDTASKVALASAPTTVTETTSGGGVNKGLLGGFMAAQMLGNDTLGITSTAKKAGQSLMETLFGAGADTPTDAGMLASDFASSTMPDLGTMAADWAKQGSGAVDYVTEAAAGVGTDFATWLGGQLGFANGGRVPTKKAWADGGRVAGLRSATTGGLPTITGLSQYSLANQDTASDPASLLGGDSESGADLGGTSGNYATADVMYGPSAYATAYMSEYSPLSTSQAASLTSTVGKAGAGMLTSYAAPGLLGPIASELASVLGTNPSAVYSTLMGRAQSTVRGLVDSPEMNTMLGNDLRRGMEDRDLDPLVTNVFNTYDPTTGAVAQSVSQNTARSMDMDPQIMAEFMEGDASAPGESNELGPGESFGPGGETVDATTSGDEYSTSPDGDTSGWGGFGDETSTWAKGGRVKGDKVVGNDDVPVKLGPKAGGGVGKLDGGEMVLKTLSVQKIDKVLGPKFLEDLNKNPDAVIDFILNGRK